MTANFEMHTHQVDREGNYSNYENMFKIQLFVV